MDHLDSTALAWAFVLLQLLGILHRLVRPNHRGLQRAGPLSVGVFAEPAVDRRRHDVGLAIGRRYWLLSSATLGAMTLAAVCDFQNADRAFTM